MRSILPFTSEMSSCEISPREIGRGKVGVREIGAGEVGAGKVSLFEVGRTQIGKTQIGRTQALPTGWATRWKQANNKSREEFTKRRYEFLALMIGSER